MPEVIGIDLGTCNSVVAIPKIRQGKYFATVDRCPSCSVIADTNRLRFTPSVIAEDEQGDIIIGRRAKARAGLSPEPIMFAKRWMGERKTFQLCHRTVTPTEVSAHIVRYLRQVAETQLGESVHEAVVTVPAYFSLRAKQETQKAVEMAGLKVKQIALEPVAAALVYCAGDGRDPLRIMTYDLGGGTFDVSILEKREGVITADSILAFDGDRFVGGYNFDRSLAFWIMDELNARNYDLQLDKRNPQDQVIFAKLMVLAERAKCELSTEEVVTIEERTGQIIDHSGDPVHIDLEIDREQFENMIQTEVEYTIQICRRALEEKPAKPLTAKDIDEIIMVGGSARIPMVGRRLEEEFGIKPQLVEPDLCVGLGAAMIAGAGVRSFGCIELQTPPAETELEILSVSGRIVPSARLGDCSGCRVTLAAMDQSYCETRTTGDDGTFLFDSVRLAYDDTISFRVTAVAPDGAEVGVCEFTVRHMASGDIGDEPAGVTDILVPDVLPKSISVMWASGPEVIVPAKTPLPFKTVIPAKTMGTSGQIHVPILEENSTLGVIKITGIPKDLPVGSEVEVTLNVAKDLKLHARAHVKALARDKQVDIDIPMPPVKSKDELENEYEELVEKAENALAAANLASAFGGGKARQIKSKLARVRDMLRDRDCDTFRVQASLDEVRTLIRALADEAVWKPRPPRQDFDVKTGEAEMLIARLVKEKPETAKDGYDDRLKAIRAEADDAFNSQNDARWTDVCSQVVRLCDDVEEMLRTILPPPPPPPPGQLLIQLSQDLARLEERARVDGRLDDELAGKFKAAAASLEKIDPQAPDASNQIWDWYQSKYKDLYEVAAGRRLTNRDKEHLLERAGKNR